MIDHAFAPEALTDHDLRHLPGPLRRVVAYTSPSTRRRREEIMDVYRRCSLDARPWPTVREVGIEVGLSSSSTVQNHLVPLIREGRLVQHHATGSRTILLPARDEPCGECGRR